MDLLRTPGTRVFVATGFGQRSDGAALMEELRKRGATITRDWTTPHSHKHADTADLDVAAVTSAQVLVVLMTLVKYEYKGTFTEIGMAIGANIPIVMISPFINVDDAVCARNVYFHYRKGIVCRYTSTTDFLAALNMQ